MDIERELILHEIANYIEKLSQIRDNIDDEINRRYFTLSCLADEMQCYTLHLNRRFHKYIIEK